MAADPCLSYSKLLKDGFQYKKWCRGVPITRKVKQIAMNVVMKTLENNPDMTIPEVYTECSELLGISSVSLKKIRSELRKSGKTSTPGNSPLYPISRCTNIKMEKNVQRRGRGACKELLYKYSPHQKGKFLKAGERRIVMNVVCKLKEQEPTKNLCEIRKEASILTGVSARSIERIQTQIKKEGKVKTPDKCRPAARGAHTRMAMMDPLHKSGIRRTIHSFMFRNELPTMKKVYRAIEMDESLPSMSLTTVHRTLKDLGFRYTKLHKHPAIMLERDDLTVWRHRHLREIRNFRKQGRKIYYTSETWVSSSHTTNSCLRTTPFKTEKPAFQEGQSASAKQSSGSESRFIVLHIGSRDGFLEGGEMCFLGKKTTGNYHMEMDGPKYESWFKKILPRLDPGSVIVTDNAPYHSVKVEQVPNKSWRKAAIQGWLRSKGVTFTPCMTIPELLVLVNEIKHGFNEYKVDVIARDAGHKVLHLPPHHCELNPIEKIWNQIKGYVAKKNTTLEPADVENLIKKGMDMVTKGDWIAAIDHVIGVEENCWKLDDLTDDIIQQLAVKVDTDLDSVSSEEDDEVFWKMSDTEPLPEDD